ncbi:MAG: DUF4429 domain-containing protein [Candidatus Binatia bacterium]
MEALYAMKGVGGLLEVFEDKVAITPKGVMGFLAKGLKATKTIPISSMTAVQFKRSGLTNGYIQFRCRGNEKTPGVFTALYDENTFRFNFQNDLATEVKEYVEARMKAVRSKPLDGPPGRLSEDLQNLADMKEGGFLSEEEFAAAHSRTSLTDEERTRIEEGQRGGAEPRVRAEQEARARVEKEKAGTPQAAAPEPVARLAAIELERKRRQRTGGLAVLGFFATAATTAVLSPLGADACLAAMLLAGALFILSLLPPLKPRFAASYTDKSTGEKVSLLWWVRSYVGFLALFLFVAFGIQSTPPPTGAPTAGKDSGSTDSGPERLAAVKSPAVPSTPDPRCGGYKDCDITAGPDKGSGSKDPTSYRIVRMENASHKALVKPLSEYTLQELEALPIDERRFCRVVVPSTITTAQVEPTFRRIVQDITSRDPDIDELYILMYSDEALIDDVYDVGAATWAPGGKMGNVSPEIARSNSRVGYSLSIEVKPDLDAYLEARRSKEVQFGLSSDVREQIFKELVLAEDRARDEAWSGHDAPADLAELGRIGDREEALKGKYSAQVRAKYKISEEVEDHIAGEGLFKRWPMPPRKRTPSR